MNYIWSSSFTKVRKLIEIWNELRILYEHGILLVESEYQGSTVTREESIIDSEMLKYDCPFDVWFWVNVMTATCKHSKTY